MPKLPVFAQTPDRRAQNSRSEGIRFCFLPESLELINLQWFRPASVYISKASNVAAFIECEGQQTSTQSEI